MPLTDPEPQVDGRKARWAGQHERRRAEFVDAALAAIALHGPEVSTQQIADQAGVARTRLYKHFADAGDLQRAVARRAAEQVTEALTPVWNPEGTPMQMVTAAVEGYLGWLRDNAHLYRYLSRHSLSEAADGADAATDIRTAVGVRLHRIFADVVAAVDGDTRPTQPLAFGIVGFVDTASIRWLDHPEGLSFEQLVRQLARWIWCMLDDSLRQAGFVLDPDRPLDLGHLST
ncbi:TetR/AcrR family transcriptional regulator [Streptacidiphilus monticola]|jgi:AcrR family transcriptional regulator|uniref:TetR/AcrR family transcriptional regulator n=1 Tax=Streptacidiphilus monticola TaxID=2161674 RepID=A0ABW1GBR3_9ACTN